MDTDKDPSGTSFDQRLHAARTRLEKPENAAQAKDTGRGFSELGLMLRAGTELVSALIVGVGIGWGLDHWLHLRAVFLVLFSLLGGAAGVLNVWRLVRPDAITDGDSGS
ncbi:AtpZ/AtpI family protein [Novacetimonas hansenii]|uniref:ATP synthase protein I n=2 Tax=Novacetimonas hansenii TaxID=436 RepID=A0AAW5ETE9_NOVHA|nr:AtpZ/AtpI family protein [Novacetimonas hansenii]EFG86045.1 ATP synthase protein I [Novacetimonas hansenii ATCC 23769]MBL7237574.1 AtpZ/AtpI family protein [Novacetimonas hansenii]MCJ8354128.1 AtpZ/AtpI family protein [Novacetimonas hansenii]QOF95351.1 AtpZ/AtpI family protein [Novacetimonas hansenii]RFP05981.1 F0F1 ATP synthase assembly protein I [Novacetimonas hansenii]